MTGFSPAAGRDVVRGVGAIVALLAFVVGVPAVLTVVAPLRLPARWPTWDSLTASVLRPDDGFLLLGAITVIAWAAWAAFAASVVVELVASARRTPTPSIPLLRWAQRAAAGLVTTAGFVLTASAPTVAASATAVATLDARDASPVTEAAATVDAPRAPSTGPTVTGASAPTASLSTAPQLPSPTTAPTEQPTVTVARGDTLWRLAERHLGDGRRFAEIVALNLGQPQSDGSALTESHWIYPGWQLRLPPDAIGTTPAAPVASVSVPDHHVVAPGDSLWDIAATRLGDGARYPEIYDLNVGRPQPDGRSLADPELLEPGWQLLLPGHGAKPPASTATLVAEEHVATDPGSAAAAPPAPDYAPPRVVAPTPATRPDAHPTADRPSKLEPVESDGEAAVEDAPAVHLFLGLTGLAAAAVVGELARRRHLQHRARGVGARIPLPAPGSPAADAEKTLRSAPTPLTVLQLRAALRNLSLRAWDAKRPLPRVGLIVLNDDVLQLHLVVEDLDPIPPFRLSGPRVWSVPTSNVVADAPVPVENGGPEPYPALITIGHTEAATVVANLEAAGTLSVVGDADAVADVMRALVLELATSDLTGRVGLVVGEEFAALARTIDPARLTCASPEDRARRRTRDATRLAHSLRDGKVADTLAARSSRTADDAWLPVIYADDASMPPTPATPWSGTALLTTRPVEDGWVLSVSNVGATLSPLNLLLTPPRVSPGDLDRVTDLLTQAERAARDVANLPNVADDTSAALHALPEPEEAGSDAAAGDGAASPLRINILGPIEIVGTPETPRPLGARSTELLVYLALRRRATGTELDDALWHGRRVDHQTRNSLIYRTRQRVGGDVIRRDADGTYRLGHDVTSDWSEFQHLVRRAYTGPDTATDDLEAALSLVRERPLAGIGAAEYVWAEADVQEIISAIVDAAHVLSSRLRAAGDTTGATRAAARGLHAEPCSELLYADAIDAATSRGDYGEAQRLVTRLRATLGELDPEYV